MPIQDCHDRRPTFRCSGLDEEGATVKELWKLYVEDELLEALSSSCQESRVSLVTAQPANFASMLALRQIPLPTTSLYVSIALT